MKQHSVIEKHKIKVIEPLEEIYPETNRKLIRPKINFLKVILIFILIEAVIVLSEILLLNNVPFFKEIGIHYAWKFIILFFIFNIIAIILLLKQIIIFVIRLYQKYGRYDIRCRCVFIPNCSEYMILAIKKYGVVKGIKMGVARLKRCNAEHGGEDYP